MNELTGKLALVTGAAGVVGLAVSKAFAADGLRVVMVDLHAERLTALAEGIGKDAVPLVLDISDPGAVAAAWETLRRDHGEVDVLVNNAGVLSND